MKKKTILGLPVLAMLLAMVLVLGSCASLLDSLLLEKWDKSTPKDQLVTLYFDESIALTHINGVQKSTGPLTKTFYGQGTEKKPKAILRIPAGELKLSLRFKHRNPNNNVHEITGTSWNDREETYRFLPGRNYQIVQIFDRDAYNKAQEENLQGAYDAAAAGGTRAGMSTGLAGGFDLMARTDNGEFDSLHFVDITKRK